MANSGVKEIARRVLIVIPQKGTAFNVFIAEYLQSLEVKRSDKVYVLDLSNMNPMHWRRQIRNLVLKFIYRNRMETMIKRICRNRDFTFLKIPREGILDEEVIALFDYEEASRRIEDTLLSTHSHVVGGMEFGLSKVPNGLIKLERFLFKLVFQTVRSKINSLGINEVVTVNGRHLVDAATVYAAESREISVNLLESGSVRAFGWRLYRSSPHNPQEDVALSRQEWRSCGENVRQAMEGLSYRLSGNRGDGSSWVSNFDSAKTLDFISKELSGRFVTYFPSTRYELLMRPGIPIPESFDGSQILAFRALVKIARIYNYQVVIRAHPSGGKEYIKNYEDGLWSDIAKDLNCYLISSESAVDSLTLMRYSNLNVFYESESAFESVAFSRPTLLLANNTRMSETFPEICALSSEDIDEFFRNGFPIVEMSKTFPHFRAIAFGGLPFQTVRADSLGNFYDLKGRPVDRLTIMFRIIKKIFDIGLYRNKVGTEVINWQ